MKIFHPPELPELGVIDPDVHHDLRGFLLETWHLDRYSRSGIPGPFVQDVHSHSERDVLRGLHYQFPNPQGKIVRVSGGRVFDVAVDVRIGSPNFGTWWGVELSGDNRRQLWIPPGFAHGFLVLSDGADFEYKCTTPYDPEASRTLAWDDPEVGVEWPTKNPTLSGVDSHASTLSELKDGGLLPEFFP